MSTTNDAVGTGITTGTSVTSLSSTLLTVGASATALTVETYFGLAISALTVTWDSGGTNQNVPSVITATELGDVGTVNINALASSTLTTGNKTLRAAWTTASDAKIAAQSWNGTDTTGGATTFNHTATNNGNTQTTTTVTCTTTTSDAVVAGHVSIQTFTAISNTAAFGGGGFNNATTIQGSAANYEVNGATATLTGTLTAADAWASAAINIKAASGAVTVKLGTARLLMGVGT